ncbi:MAG: ATPase [Flavobacteriaceae bacterium]|nr:ATPase [Flavobacteriaceae bacterium]|tara:strand:- start:3298 stop:3651 length:354 start_codon:yes stop_codon:yes gene_type:complete
MRLIIITLLLLLVSSIGFSQNNSNKTIEVDGVCKMCKKRIEKACLKTKGVKSAVWNVKTHELNLIYNPKKVDLEAIKTNIAAVGHDTKTLKAPEEVYVQLDACCKYRDPKVVKDHND